jgi:hypothetical protein
VGLVKNLRPLSDRRRHFGAFSVAVMARIDVCAEPNVYLVERWLPGDLPKYVRGYVNGRRGKKPALVVSIGVSVMSCVE